MVGRQLADLLPVWVPTAADPFMVEWHAPMDGSSRYLEPCHHPDEFAGWPARRGSTVATCIVMFEIVALGVARRVWRWHGWWRQDRIDSDVAPGHRSARGRGWAASSGMFRNPPR
jgi:hypothetical protein